VVGFSALKDAFATNAQQIKQQLAVFKEMDRDGTGRVNFEEFKDAFQRAFHAPSVAQAKFLRQFFLQLTGGQPTLDFRRFLIGLALVGGTKESASETTPETSASPDSPTSPSQSSTAAPLDFDALADRYKAQMFVQLAFAAFAANADDRIFWKEFEELWTWIHPAGIQEDSGVSSGDVKNESMSASARKAFESIGGAGVQELTFDAAAVSMKEQSAQTEGIFFESGVQTDDFPAPLTNSMDFVYDVGMDIAGDQLLPCSTFAKECHDRVEDAIDEWAYDVYRLHEDAEIAVYKRNGQLIFCSCDSSG